MNIICLLETRVAKEKKSDILHYLLPGWSCIDDYMSAPLGRIWILHDNSVYISVYNCSAQAIHCHAYSMTLERYFFLSVVYASNDEYGRRSLWQGFLNLSQYMNNIPWIAFGDFNVIHSMQEKSDYFDGMLISRSVHEFRECLMEVGLTDLPSDGVFFTCSNKRVDGFVAKKLDRILVNHHWLQGFSDMTAAFTPPEFSDHSAGWINCSSTIRAKSEPFRFFNFLARHPDFLSTVRTVWQQPGIYGSQMYQICRKLKALKPSLKTLSKTHFSDIHQKVDKAKSDLLSLQKELLPFLL